MARLPDEIRRFGVAALNFHRKRVYSASQRWIRLRDRFRAAYAVSAAAGDMPSAAIHNALAVNAERIRSDCAKVYHYLYKVGVELFDEDELSALPLAPAVMVFGAITTLAALVAWLKWIGYQEKRLDVASNADTARLKQTLGHLRAAKESRDPEVKRAHIEAARELNEATAKGLPKVDDGGGFFSGLLPKVAIAYGLYKYGPQLLSAGRGLARA